MASSAALRRSPLAGRKEFCRCLGLEPRGQRTRFAQQLLGGLTDCRDDGGDAPAGATPAIDLVNGRRQIGIRAQHRAAELQDNDVARHLPSDGSEGRCGLDITIGGQKKTCPATPEDKQAFVSAVE